MEDTGELNWKIIQNTKFLSGPKKAQNFNGTIKAKLESNKVMFMHNQKILSRLRTGSILPVSLYKRISQMLTETTVSQYMPHHTVMSILM